MNRNDTIENIVIYIIVGVLVFTGHIWGLSLLLFVNMRKTRK